MNGRRFLWVLLVGTLLAGAALSTIERNAIAERYYAWRLGNASVEAGWEIAEKLAAMDSESAVHWYGERLSDSTDLAEAGRAAEFLAEIGTRVAIEVLLETRPTPLPPARTGTSTLMKTAVDVFELIPVSATPEVRNELRTLVQQRLRVDGDHGEPIELDYLGEHLIVHWEWEPRLARVIDVIKTSSYVLWKTEATSLSMMNRIAIDTKASEDLRLAARVLIESLRGHERVRFVR